MPFTKIKEAVNTFKKIAEAEKKQSKMDLASLSQSSEEFIEKVEMYNLTRMYENSFTAKVRNFGVMAVLVVPTAYAMNTALVQILSNESVLASIALSVSLTIVIHEFLWLIPFHRFNPLFGSKMREAAASISESIKKGD